MRVVESLLGIFIGNAIVGAVMLTVSMYVAEGASIELLLIALVTMVIGFYLIKNNRNKKNISTN